MCARCQRGHAQAQAGDGDSLAQRLAQTQLPLEPAHFALAGRASARTVALVVALTRRVVNLIRPGNLATDSLQRLTDLFPSFHIIVFVVGNRLAMYISF